MRIVTLLLIVFSFKLKKARASFDCPKGWFKNDDNCYLYHPGAKNYKNSLLSCQSYGASLLSIKDKAEDKFILDYCRKQGIPYLWIGLHDNKSISQKRFGQWSNGAPVLYTNWLSGEPNNAGGNEDCVVLLLSTGDWSDYSCDMHNFAYICKLEKGSYSLTGSWSEWGACSEICQSNPWKSPFQTRQCISASLNGGCHGESSQICNTGVPCQGYYSVWSAWGACSERCQSNPSMSPFQTQTRQCIGSSFNGGCYGASSQTQTCNTGVPCAGYYSVWSAWGACSGTCQSNPSMSPFQTQIGQCIGATFNGGCYGASSQTQTCNTGVSCPGNYGSWNEWGACSGTCQSNPSMSPFQTQIRQCIGATFNGGCYGASSQTRTCNTGVSCPGNYGSWNEWGACSGTCQSNPRMSPFQTQIRQCIGATFNGGCYGVNSQTRNCNTRVSCPGYLTDWSSWIVCTELYRSVNCQKRFRNCAGVSSFESNYVGCDGAILTDQRQCNKNDICPE